MSDSNVTQDYVKLIYAAREFGGEPLTVSRLAERLSVAASTASETVKRLGEEGLVVHRPYRGIDLTDRGRELAVRMVRRHRILETYLVARLGFTWDQVHAEAEVLEHAVSERLIEAMDRELGYPRFDPHGDPIPSVAGETDPSEAINALELDDGTSVRVVRVSDSDSQVLRYLAELGLQVDAEFKFIERKSALGLATIEVGGKPVEVTLAAISALWVR